MKSIEIAEKTYDEALNKALRELNVTKDNVEVEVIEAGTRGLFNLIGGKPTKIRVTVKKTSVEEAEEFLLQVLESMKIKAEVETTEECKEVKMNVKGSSMGTIIGYRGETLDSLQYLVSLVLNKNHDESYRRLVLDAENYRQKRTDTLKRVAEKTAYKVRNSKRAYKLEPMNPYERRVIHAALQDKEDICTYSEGVEPRRRVVVDVKRD